MATDFSKQISTSYSTKIRKVEAKVLRAERQSYELFFTIIC
jgi:hypothetical protein